MKRVLADELSHAPQGGIARVWSSSDENRARELRCQVASALAGAKSLPPEALPLIVYLLREEPTRPGQSSGVKALGLLAGGEAQQLRLALVSEPHANAQVVAEALEQLARGGDADRTVPTAVTDALGRHPRAIVRAAARAIRRSPDFDPVAALASPQVARLLANIDRLLVDVPAPDAPFVRATVTSYLIVTRWGRSS